MLKLSDIYYVGNAERIQRDISLFRETLKKKTICSAIIDTFTEHAERIAFNQGANCKVPIDIIHECLNSMEKTNVFVEVKRIDDIGKISIYFGGYKYEGNGT